MFLKSDSLAGGILLLSGRRESLPEGGGPLKVVIKCAGCGIMFSQQPSVIFAFASLRFHSNRYGAEWKYRERALSK